MTPRFPCRPSPRRGHLPQARGPGRGRSRSEPERHGLGLPARAMPRTRKPPSMGWPKNPWKTRCPVPEPVKPLPSSRMNGASPRWRRNDCGTETLGRFQGRAHPTAEEAMAGDAPPISGQDVEDRLDSLFGSEESRSRGSTASMRSHTATWTPAPRNPKSRPPRLPPPDPVRMPPPPPPGEMPAASQTGEMRSVGPGIGARSARDPDAAEAIVRGRLQRRGLRDSRPEPARAGETGDEDLEERPRPGRGYRTPPGRTVQPDRGRGRTPAPAADSPRLPCPWPPVPRWKRP